MVRKRGFQSRNSGSIPDGVRIHEDNLHVVDLLLTNIFNFWYYLMRIAKSTEERTGKPLVGLADADLK